MNRCVMKIEGMRCGMCEAHVNQIIRSSFPVHRVKSNARKGCTVLLCEQPPDYDRLKDIISKAGYTLLSAETETVQKKTGIFRWK